MLNDYNSVRTISRDEFDKHSYGDELNDPTKFTKSTPEDVESIERLLDVQPGTLRSGEYYCKRVDCECGHTLTTYDFVLTSLVDANHSKSFVLHTFVGSKLVNNPQRFCRCSNCSRIFHQFYYEMKNSYSCTA